VEWLGEVPEHWEIKPLFALMKERQVKNVGNKVQNVLSLSYGNIVRRDVESNFGLLPESFETYQIVEPGNIILRLTDLQNDHRSLRTGRVTQSGIITSAYVCLDISNISSPLDPLFSHYLLHGYDLLKVFYAYGGGVRQSMKFKDLKRLPIVYPGIEEQRTIVTFLDRETAQIDTLIAKQERLIALLQEKRQALISHVVTKGLNPAVPMKESGVAWLGEVPTHWELRRTKYLFDLMNRPPRDDDGIVTAFRDGTVTLRSNRRVEGFTNSIKEIGYQGIRKGDLVIHVMDAFAGAVGVSDSDGKSTPVYSVCKPISDDVSAPYYGRILRHMALSGFINSLAKGIRERSTEFRWAEASRLPLPVPSVEEQRLITTARSMSAPW
jgi:type I restriction enzyme S subunit